LDRRQTEGDIQRNFYVVEVIYSNTRESSMSSTEDAGNNRTETLHVDLSRILEYVSPDELERFENEQFRIEAEAEAVAMRVEAEELARKRLEKNTRPIAIGQGSGMLSGLGLDHKVRTRGRPRGRARGRGQGSWRGRGALVTSIQPYEEDMGEELVDIEPVETLRRVEEDMQPIIAETDSEEDARTHQRGPTSPSIARSAFVANSALPVSPVSPHRRLPIIPSVQHDDDESDVELVNVDAGSISSAAMQLRIEDDVRGRSNDSSEAERSHSGHRSKRRRKESTTSNQRVPPPKTIVSDTRRPYKHTSSALSTPESSARSEPADISISAQPLVPVYCSLQAGRSDDMELDNTHVHTPVAEPPMEEPSEEEEEYVVAAIIDHYRDDVGKKWYLVKWQGYEDSYDWLAEEDLEGAAELVAEYKVKMRKKKKQKMMR
jgi:hypothetical protein